METFWLIGLAAHTELPTTDSATFDKEYEKDYV